MKIAHYQENDKNGHKCDFCGLDFSSKYFLKNHVSRVHEGLQFTCNVCKKSFVNEKGFSNHTKVYHGESNFPDIIIHTNKQSSRKGLQ